jgi:hypothetical protein
MISIINNINTTVTVGQVMGYSLITLILLLLLLSLRNIIGEVAQNQRQIRILVQNLNLISIPLLIMFTVLIIVYYS